MVSMTWTASDETGSDAVLFPATLTSPGLPQDEEVDQD